MTYENFIDLLLKERTRVISQGLRPVFVAVNPDTLNQISSIERPVTQGCLMFGIKILSTPHIDPDKIFIHTRQ